MIAIAAVDENWAIGSGNKLLFSIPEDMRFFRETTTGKTVVMGRKTLESFPGGRPLKNRRNLVLSKQRNLRIEGAEIVSSPEELLTCIRDENPREVFVIGGASVYELLLPHCEKALITKMYRRFPADAYFPNLDEQEHWKITEQSALYNYEGLDYRFLTYTNGRV